MTTSHWLNIFSSWTADLCEKKIPLRRKRWGVCPATFSILSTSSWSILLLPNRTEDRHDKIIQLLHRSLSEGHTLALLNHTYEFVIIHSLGVCGGNVPRVNCVFISAICCWPVIRANRVFWGRTACLVVLTCHLFVIHFQLQQQLHSSVNFSLRNPNTAVR